MKISSGCLTTGVFGIACAVILSSVDAAGQPQPPGEVLRRSGDAYVSRKGTDWFLGTSKVQREIKFEKEHLSLRGFLDPRTHHEYIQGTPSEIFRFDVDGQTVTSESQPWALDGSQTEILSQGELLFSIVVHNQNLKVTKNYVIYPEESIIQEWASLTNISGKDIVLVDPHFLQMHVLQKEASHLDFSYMTGGMCFWGSWILKTEPLTPNYARNFDASDGPECLPGQPCPKGWSMGNSIYAPIYVFLNRKGRNGLFVGWDYLGRWASHIGNYNGGPVNIDLQVSGYKRSLAPGSSEETPKAFAGLFEGDLDEMGNQLLDYQYRYKWDYTREKYFPAIQMLGYWWNGATDFDPKHPGMDVDPVSTFRKVFRMADTMRYVGADRYWRDYGWWDVGGDWNGPDFNSTRRYLDKYGMTQTIYTIVYDAEQGSRVVTEHPDWLIYRGGRFAGQYVLDQSRPGVTDYELGILDREVSKWGDFEWRKDDAPLHDVKGDYTPMLAQDHNFRTLLKNFLDRNPGNSFHGCNGGGNDLGYEVLRMANAWQYSDGCVGRYRVYYTSYLFPPDKLNNMPDNWDPDKYEKSVWRGLLWNSFPMTGDTLDSAKLEGLRLLIDIYHYLAGQGVVGRWVKIYHPAVTGDAADWYLQRMSPDNKRGIIIPAHSLTSPATVYRQDGTFAAGTSEKQSAPDPIVLFPKGLLPSLKYNVSYQESKATEERLGSELMAKGIAFAKMEDGELVYLNLPMHPGSAADTTPPAAPSQVVKRIGTNMGFIGTELSWTAATDNNWVSYYEILRNGKAIDKVAKGSYYFDHSAGADLAARYEVQAVDGSANASEKAVAHGGSHTENLVVDDTAKELTYTGKGWKHEQPVASAHNGTQSSSREAGDAVEYAFRGNRIAWYGRLGSAMGKADVQIDGKLDSIVDCYDADEILNVAVYTRTFPSIGEHRIKIALRADRHNLSSDNWVTVDGFQVGRLEMSVVEDRPGGGIEYSGSGWKHGAAGWEQASEGNTSWTSAPGDAAEYRFQGDGVTWVGKRCPSCGQADVYIDGMLDATVDTYMPDDHSFRPDLQGGWQVPIYQRTWTESGQHTIRITIKPDKNMLSNDHTIYLDSLEVSIPEGQSGLWSRAREERSAALAGIHARSAPTEDSQGATTSVEWCRQEEGVMESVGKLNGKKALVTGSGTGIGREIALEFARQGADVVLHYGHSDQGAVSAVEEIKTLGRRAAAFKANFENADEAVALAKQGIAFLDGLDCLVNNAGITMNRPFLKVSHDQFDTLMNVNLRSPFFLAQYVVEHMLKHGGGTICNLTSVHGVQGASEHSVYAATKGAIIAYTRTLGIELAHRGVRVNAIAPGWVTVEGHFKAQPGLKPDEYEAAAQQMIPVARSGRPLDIARLAVFLSSADAEFIIGQTIIVDGGTTSLMSLMTDFRTESKAHFGTGYVPGI